MGVVKVTLNSSPLIDITDTTAAAADVASGKYFYNVAGNKTAGTSSGGGGGEYGWLGQNATVVQTYNSLTYSLSETSYSTWTPSTTSTKILDAQTFGQFTLTDLGTYDYYLLETFNFTPVRVAGAYTTTTIERYLWMVVYGFYKGYSTVGAVVSQTPDVTNGYTYATRWLFYYGSTGVLGLAVSSNYGVFPYNDTVSSDYTTIIKNITTPQINARCSTSYFTTTRAAELDQDESKFEITAKIIRVDRPSIVSKPSTILADLDNNPLT